VIVTRRRRKPFPWRRLILPVVAIALVVFALVWAPSRNVITSGPAAPMWQKASTSFTTVAAPFHFAAQNQVIQDRNHQIVELQAQLADAKAQGAAKDKQISTLNAQVSQLQTQAATAHNAPAAPAAPATTVAQSAAAAAPGAQASSSPESEEDSRTAQYWANMEPENAAKVIQKLPVPYVARVMAQMSPDAVGAILDQLPAPVAAQLTQENPQLKR
jgi:flagellar motility protein MotE (MotC chaperone)